MYFIPPNLGFVGGRGYVGENWMAEFRLEDLGFGLSWASAKVKVGRKERRLG